MNLIDAIKSGKRHKRPSHEVWRYQPETKPEFYIMKEDLLADDWIIEEKKIEITEAQIRRAFERTWALGGNYSNAIDYFLNELGFD